MRSPNHPPMESITATPPPINNAPANDSDANTRNIKTSMARTIIAMMMVLTTTIEVLTRFNLEPR